MLISWYPINGTTVGKLARMEGSVTSFNLRCKFKLAGIPVGGALIAAGRMIKGIYIDMVQVSLFHFFRVRISFSSRRTMNNFYQVFGVMFPFMAIH